MNLFAFKKGDLEYTAKIIDTLLAAQSDRKLTMAIPSLKQAIVTSKIYESLSTSTIESQMIKERLALLLGESFIKPAKSDQSYLMRTMWLSRSQAEYEEANDSVAVSLDITLARIKTLLSK